MTNINNVARLDRALKAAGVAIDGVSPDATAPGGYRVSPASLQSAAQPIIDSFNPDDPVHANAELNLEAIALLDNQRVYAAIVWVLLRTIYPADTVPQTKNKFNAQPNGARQQVIDAFGAQPWK